MMLWRREDERDGATERSRLITPLEDHGASTNENLSHPLSRPLLIYFFIFFALLETGEALHEAPRTQLYENIICQKYYARLVNDSIPSGHSPIALDCKIQPVQSQLAYLVGIQDALAALPAIFVSIPAAYTADKIGRAPIMTLAVLGYFLGILWIAIVCARPDMFNIFLVWVYPAFTLLAGGTSTASSLVFATAGDFVSEEQRYTRVNTYIVIVAIAMGAMAVGRILTSILMIINSWVPFIICLGILFIIIPMACYWPDTRRGVGVIIDSVDAPIERVTQGNSEPLEFEYSPIVKKMKSRLVRFAQHLGFHRRVYVFFIVSLLVFLTRWFQTPFLQYASNKYNIGYSEANLLQSMITIANVVVWLGLFPLVSQFVLARWSLDASQRNMFSLKLATLAFALGSFILGLAHSFVTAIPGVITYGIGAGSLALLRSMVLSFVSQEHYNVAQTTLSVLLVSAKAAAGPMYSAALSESFTLHGIWTGMPCFVSGACSLLAVLVLMFINPKT